MASRLKQKPCGRRAPAHGGSRSCSTAGTRSCAIRGCAFRRVFATCGTVGTRSRAIRGSTSDDRVGCSASDGRCAPARPALHVSTRLLTFLPRALASTDCIRSFPLLRLLLTCSAGRAGNHRRSDALHRMSLSDNLRRLARERVPERVPTILRATPDRAGAPPLNVRQRIALNTL